MSDVTLLPVQREVVNAISQHWTRIRLRQLGAGVIAVSKTNDEIYIDPFGNCWIEREKWIALTLDGHRLVYEDGFGRKVSVLG